MKKPIARKNNIVVQEVRKETLIYDLDEDKAYCLNETSALVWGLCDGKRTPIEISAEMSETLKTKISEDFVDLALDQLNKEGLFENGIKNTFEGLSRRRAIRKIGMTSVAMLPAIGLIVAPRAAMAQSCAGIGTLAPGTSLAFPFPDPSPQANQTVCQSYCFNVAPFNPEPTCCSGLGRSDMIGYSPASGICDCVGYQCV